jgi:hypothetical protein
LVEDAESIEYNRWGFVRASGRHLVLKELSASLPPRGKKAGATDELSSAKVSYNASRKVAYKHIIRLLELGKQGKRG